MHAVLTGLGSGAAGTQVVADVLLETDLRGQRSHGILRLPCDRGARASRVDLSARQREFAQVARAFGIAAEG